jgi:TatD DNase family protein
MKYFIDTHAHIYHEDFARDLSDVLHRAAEQQVLKVFMPNVDHRSIDAMLEVEARFADTAFPMMGVHPCSIKKDFQRELYLVEDWLAKRKFFAIGEIGTDLYWDKTFFEQQKEAFLVQVRWAKEYSLPVVIHCRESIDETIAMVEQEQDGTLRGVFHCFSGNTDQAERITKLGFYLGIGGVATFKNAGLDAVIPEIALEKIVLETDSPYLAPVPHRGKRNEPSYISVVAQRVAELKRCHVEEIQEITTSNAQKLFDSLA